MSERLEARPGMRWQRNLATGILEQVRDAPHRPFVFHTEGDASCECRTCKENRGEWLRTKDEGDFGAKS